MGCDYYIAKCLIIYFVNGDFLTFELQRNKGYYFPDVDEDDENYEEKILEYKLNCLRSNVAEITVYVNDHFVNSTIKEKYQSIVEENIKMCHKEWGDILKIIKFEHRYENE